ncbi:MAG: tRNA-guanine transglycosylase DpdA [Candidatus Bathyarchaeia archaeon]
MMRYFIPEWDDRVDPNYDFINEKHSDRHNYDPYSDHYMWEIFGLESVPFDGVLVSRVKVEEDKVKKSKIQELGIHRFLRLPSSFPILGDCGAFGYVDDLIPRYDPIEILEYYQKLGFNIGVTVDHLVVPKYAEQKDFRMKITYENGLKAFYEWKKRYAKDFLLLCAVQGWDIQDYIKMIKNYQSHGIENFGIGGLARKSTAFIISLVNKIIEEIKNSGKVPNQMHFFGVARVSLFPHFKRLEDFGIEITFDSASFLRKAWLSARSNYITLDGRGYAAIRVPQIGKNLGLKGKKEISGAVNYIELKRLEQECLQKIRLYDKGQCNIESVMLSLESFDKAIKQNKFLTLKKYYLETLKDAPWKKCSCPICREIGVEIIIFRGNNRNRRRGFHNVWVFYQILKNPSYWTAKPRILQLPEIDLTNLKKGEKVLVITACTKEKLGYTPKVKALAKDMYRGLLFRLVKKFCEVNNFDYVIISAKYGLLFPEEEIEGYEKVLRTKEDVEVIRPIVEERLRKVLDKYEKVVVIAGANYLKTLERVIDDRFYQVKGQGYGDICSKVRKALDSVLAKKIHEFIYISGNK